MLDNLYEVGSHGPLYWMAACFLLGVAAVAFLVDRITRRPPSAARVWQVFAVIVVVGLVTLFAMFILPEWVFHWDFCFRRGSCSTNVALFR